MYFLIRIKLNDCQDLLQLSIITIMPNTEKATCFGFNTWTLSSAVCVCVFFKARKYYKITKTVGVNSGENLNSLL